MSDQPNMAAITDTDVAQKRIDLLFRLNGNFIALTFAALATVNAVFAGQSGLFTFAPLLGLALLAVANGLLRLFYRHGAGKAATTTAERWERNLTLLALLTSAVWGVGGLIWFTPADLNAQHGLLIAFIGMAVTEGQARVLNRFTHVSHILLALGPLAIRFALTSPPEISAILILVATGLSLTLYAAGVRHRYTALFVRENQIELRLMAMAHAKASAEAERDQAQELVRQKTAFVCGVSHELRTPLNAFLGMAQILERGDLTSTQRNQARILMEAGRGFQTLLDDILIMAEDEPARGVTMANGLPPTSDPAVVVRNITRLLQPIIWERRLHLNVTTANGLPRIAIGAHALRQVLLKLAQNAIQFTPDGTITLITEAVQKAGTPLVRFTVSDTGLGVPPEIIPTLFDSRLHSSMASARGAGQSGIGLAVAKRIVEASGGEIGFESALGEGSTFWFTVPVAAGHGEEDEPGASAVSVPPPANLVLLIALPSRTTEKEIEDVLAPYGNRVQFATGPADLALRATRENFDAIITTADMAGMLAAAPGEKAPILALNAPGDNKPAVSATTTLAWPCAAWRLYAALKAIHRVRKDMPARPAGQTSQIDSIAVAELEKSVGTGTLVEIFRTYLETSGKVSDEVAEAAGKEDWETIGRVARDIAGSASGLGLVGVTACARAFAAAQREAASDEMLQQLAQAIITDSARTREALLALYPELDETAKEAAG